MKKQRILIHAYSVLFACLLLPAEARETVISPNSATALQVVFRHMQKNHFVIGKYAFKIVENSKHVEISAIAPAAVEHPDYARGGLFYRVAKGTNKLVKFEAGK